MMNPDWKIQLAEYNLRENIPAEGQHQDVANLMSVLDGTCKSQEAIKDVKFGYDIYKNKQRVREALEGCLLCEDATLEDIKKVTGISIHLIDVYAHFFFDVDVFEYRLLRMQYVDDYENPKFFDGKLYKNWAVSVGIQFFLWHFNVPGYNVPPAEILTDLIGDSFFRAKEHINESITSPTAKESLKWMKQGTDTIVALQKVDGNKGNEALTNVMLALEYEEHDSDGDEIDDAEIIG